MSHKRTNGERMGNIQFGYRLCSDGKHVEPDRAEQAVLDESGAYGGAVPRFAESLRR